MSLHVKFFVNFLKKIIKEDNLFQLIFLNSNKFDVKRQEHSGNV